MRRSVKRARLARALAERIFRTVVERANVLVAEPRFVDLDIGAEQQWLRQFLDGKSDGVGGAVEAAVFDLVDDLAVARGKQLCRRIEIEFIHDQLQTLRPRRND